MVPILIIVGLGIMLLVGFVAGFTRIGIMMKS